MSDQFAAQVRRWSDETKEKLDLAVRKISLEVFSNVIMLSPVGNPDRWKNPAPKGYIGGRFRGNWQVAIGSAPVGTLEAIDPFGNVVTSRAQAPIGAAEAGDVIYMVNNLPYARRLEDGWSSIAPNGMVALTVQKFQPIADAVIRDIASRG